MTNPLKKRVGRVLQLMAATLAASYALGSYAQVQAQNDRKAEATSSTSGEPASSRDPQILKGAYLARVGDCIACHTAAKGVPFAGGLAIKTPFGTIYSTNITPDRQHGIGAYTYDDFAKALRAGIARDGHHLYPAMPYPSFSKIDDADMHALYAYFMQGVQPVAAANKVNALTFPFNIRALMIGWNLLYRPQGVYLPDPHQSVAWNRGAYLVQGLGHCGACHTPHGVTGQERAFGDKGNTVFLSGYTLAGWHASSLRGDAADGLGRWTVDDIVAFLSSGRTAHTAPFGAMTEVVSDSTQYMNNEDLHAVATYLKGLPPAHPGSGVVKVGGSIQQAAAPSAAAPLREGHIASTGALVYLNSCNACHRSDGTGAPGVFPTLRGNSAVLGKDPTSLIHIVLSGSRMPSTSTRPSALAMPDFGWRLDDTQVADVLTFIRSSWGNQASAVTADQVSKVRHAALEQQAGN